MVCQHGRLQAVCYDCRKNDKFTFAIRAQLEAAQAKLNTQKAYYESVFEDGAKQIKKFKDELAALKEVRDNCTLVPTDKLKAMQGELATLKQALLYAADKIKTEAEMNIGDRLYCAKLLREMAQEVK